MQTIFKSYWRVLSILLFALLTANTLVSHAQSNEDCFMCHEDESLTKTVKGKTVSLYVDSKIYDNSAHRNVKCADCHNDVTDDFLHSETLDLKKVDCGRCHQDQAKQAHNDIHHKLKDRVGDNGPTCKTCHNTHQIYNPSDIKDKSKVYCGKCHTVDVLSSKYHLGESTTNSCVECHDTEYGEKLKTSVHSKLSCANCHSYPVNNMDDHMDFPKGMPAADCYLCHRSIAAEHRESIHGISLAEGINESANCWDCHGSHNICEIKCDSSLVNDKNIVSTCGKCHDNPEFNEKFFSTVKQPGKMYSLSIHGKLVESGDSLAPSCITCHGIHTIKNRIMPESSIASINISTTCGQCHQAVQKDYEQSIHWIAVKKGVREAPTCNDCHSEHSMKAINTAQKRSYMKKIQDKTCMECHQNLLLSERYSIESHGASSYQDTYHGLAVERGDEDAAMCVDCHGVHNILPKYIEESSISELNLTKTCKKCHTNATEVFSKSYTHVPDPTAPEVKVQRIITKIYFWLIIIVIGGMILHNMVIFFHDIRKRYKLRNKEISIPRFTLNELIQHTLLLVTFILLAITGFQLKYPDSWWSEGLTWIGLNEFTRQIVHRICAVLMILLSIYHILYLAFTSRGRATIISFVPNIKDFIHVIQNMMYNLGLRKKHPEFGYYDYAEKAEYWALIWGTAVMGITGLILWFPTIVGDWAPLWTIKVAEIIHFYEAILATLAIIVWHWFFVVFRPQEYPVSYTVFDGKMTITHYKDEHKQKFKEIMLEYLEFKGGIRPEKKIGSLSKIFIKSVEKAGVVFDDFIKTEIEKDNHLKDFLEEKDVLKFLT